MTTGIATCNLYRRKSLPSVNADKAGYFVSGDEIDIKDVVIGDPFEGVNTWYQLESGIHIWSGGVSLNLTDPIFLKKLDLDKTIPLPSTSKPYDPKNYWWIHDYGIDKIWDMGITGRGVKIAVLDEGLDIPHPDLPILTDENFVDITGNKKQKFDPNWHGTHVFGMLAASNNGFGITGLCHNSEFFFAKIHHFENGYEHQYLISAIDWAIDKKVDIISISQGSNRKLDEIDLQKLNECLDRAVLAKIAIFCAAGNDGGTTIKRIPAKISSEKKIFSIGHINSDKKTTETTVLDTKVSVFAPGFKIISTGRKSSELYFEDSGSSMATPYVAGIACLILEEKRKDDPSFSALDAADLLLSTAENANFGKIVNPKKIFNL